MKTNISRPDPIFLPKRDVLIRRAHHAHGYMLTAIGKALDLHYTIVSKVINHAN